MMYNVSGTLYISRQMIYSKYALERNYLRELREFTLTQLL